MKKIIAPLIVTALFIIYFVVYFAVLIFVIPSLVAKIMLGIIPLAFAAVMIYVCIQRIKEIRSGEEDDLSKY